MRRLRIIALAWILALLPLYAAAEIRVSDKNGVFLGYLAGDGDIGGSRTIRLFLPKYNRFVTYVHEPLGDDYNILTTHLFYLEPNCQGDAYIGDASKPHDEILRIVNSNFLYTSSNNKRIYDRFESRQVGVSAGLLCSNIVSIIPARKAKRIIDGAIPLSLGNDDRQPLKFEWETSTNPVVVPFPTR